MHMKRSRRRRRTMQVAELLGADAEEIVFTGGGTEASNHAIKGSVFARFVSKNLFQALLKGVFGRWGSAAHVVISAIEHPATVQPCEFLKRLGCRVTVVPVDGQGLVDPDAVRKALGRGATLVSVMHSNNEVGTLQPIKEIAAIAKERGALVHTDAAQSLGKVAVNVRDLGVDLLTLAGHKLYAPKGVGVLFVRKGVQLEPCLHGAGHESGRRAGTEERAVCGRAGDMACSLAQQSLPGATEKLRRLRELLWERLRAKLGERVVLNGHRSDGCRTPSTPISSVMSARSYWKRCRRLRPQPARRATKGW